MSREAKYFFVKLLNFDGYRPNMSVRHIYSILKRDEIRSGTVGQARLSVPNLENQCHERLYRLLSLTMQVTRWHSLQLVLSQA